MESKIPPGVWQELAEIRYLAQRLADRYAPEWVRVDERLPRNGEKVLLYNRYPEWIVVGRRQGDTYYAAWHPPMEVGQPTHWLPLPEPPPTGT